MLENKNFIFRLLKLNISLPSNPISRNRPYRNKSTSMYWVVNEYELCMQLLEAGEREREERGGGEREEWMIYLINVLAQSGFQYEQNV